MILECVNRFFSIIQGVGGQSGAVQRCPTCRGTGMQVCKFSNLRNSLVETNFVF